MQGTCYIILRKDGTDRYVVGIESTLTSATAYPTETYEYVHWNIDCCGPCPAINNATPWVDVRTYDLKRRCGYKADCDDEYIRYRGRVERDGDDDATAKAPWLAACVANKAKYPKP